MGKSKKGDGEAKGSGKSKKMLVPIVALVAGVIVGPKLMGGGATAEAQAPTTTTTALGPIVTLDSITLNLADGHLLKVGITLQLSAAWIEENGLPAEVDPTVDSTRGYARAMDAAITVFGTRTMPELLTPDGREEARLALVSTLGEVYEGRIESVYLYEFVMQ